MLYLHAGSLERVKQYHHPNIGRFLQPRNFSRLADTLEAGYVVGVDNEGYSGVDFPRFDRMLASIRDTLRRRVLILGQPPQDGRSCGELRVPENFLWVLVPDVHGDADATYHYFQSLYESMADLPLAYAVQDGAGDAGIPLDAPSLRCLFLAGSNEYKESTEMAEIASAAKAHGLWLHGAPCNSAKRARLFADLGCDSFDGTGASKFPSLIPRYLAWAAQSPHSKSPGEIRATPGTGRPRTASVSAGSRTRTSSIKTGGA